MKLWQALQTRPVAARWRLWWSTSGMFTAALRIALLVRRLIKQGTERSGNDNKTRGIVTYLERWRCVGARVPSLLTRVVLRRANRHGQNERNTAETMTTKQQHNAVICINFSATKTRMQKLKTPQIPHLNLRRMPMAKPVQARWSITP